MHHLLPAFCKVLSLLRFYSHCICFLWGQFLRNTIFHFIVMRTIPIFILLPLESDKRGMDTLLACLADVKAWVSLNVLHLNENKTVIIFLIL